MLNVRAQKASASKSAPPGGRFAAVSGRQTCNDRFKFSLSRTITGGNHVNNDQVLSTHSSVKRSKKAIKCVEPLESRCYLSGVVFGTPQSLSTAAAGIAPVYTDLADLNGDGFADLITANSNNSASILFGKGDGTFTLPAETFPLSFTPLTIVDGQLDPSGKTDFVVGSTTSDAVAVVLQNANGTFTKQELAATGLTNTQSVALGNFGNGRQDIAVASYDGGASDNVAVFLNNGNGTFSAPQILSVPHSQVASITAFATSGGVIDLAVADSHDSAITVLSNNGTGTFSVGPDYPLAASSTPVTIKAGKFNLNNNTNDDLVTANANGGSISVLLGNGDGTFQSAPITTVIPGVVSGGGLLKVRVANLDASGRPDLLGLLSPGSSGDAVVLLDNGDGTFRVGNTISLGAGAQTSIAAGDLNGDGLTDLVLANANQVSAILNTTGQDTTPPTAAVDVTQPAVTAGSSTIQFTVTYSDAAQVDASTLSSGNITVTDPHGNNQPVTLVSTGLTSAASLTVTYQIPAPSGSLSSSDDGAYTVSATATTASAVKNANRIAVAAGSIGQFSVQVPSQGTPTGPNLVCTISANLPASAVAGVTRSSGGTVVIVNSGNQVAKGRIVIDIYASPDATIRGNAPLVATVTRNINIRAGGRAVFAMPTFLWPASLSGTYFLVADVNATGALTETSLTDNTNISAKSTLVVPPFVDIDNLWSTRLPAGLKVGRRVLIPVLLKNIGNVAARNTATVTVQASPDGSASDATTIGTPAVRVVIPAGLRGTINVPVTLPTLAAGSYHLIVTVSYPGDADAANDTVISGGTFTV